MTLRHLTIFREICRSNSFTKTAEVLNTSQPAISTAIKELEVFFGKTLFERMNRKIYLTPAGEVLRDNVENILSQYDHTIQVLRHGIAFERLRIGSNYTFGSLFLPKAVSEYTKLHSNVDIRMKIENSLEIENKVISNDLDLAIVDNMTNSPYLVYHYFCKDELYVVYDPKSFQFKDNKVTLAELANYPLLLREPGSGIRKCVDKTFSSKSVVPNFIRLESALPFAVTHCAQSGLGIAIISAFHVSPMLQSGKLVRLEVTDASFVRDIFIIHHRSKQQTEIIRDFIAYLNKMEKS